VDTEGILNLLSSVRPLGNNRYIALCPAHEDHSRSFTLRQTEDGKLLIHCFAGCRPTDICQALGIRLADLYSTSRFQTPDPKAVRRRLAMQGLERWRQAELQRVGQELRGRDIIIRIIDRAVETGVIVKTKHCHVSSMSTVATLNSKTSFWRLLRGENVLALWRESKKVA
jgi:hypothetical protein